MNVRHWQHFLAIAELQSLTRAADRIGVPQPVLSREMRELESSLGSKVLTRHARGVALTPAGQTFRKRATAIAREIDHIGGEIAASDRSMGGRLSFGMAPSMAGLLTGPMVAQFHQRFPQ